MTSQITPPPSQTKTSGEEKMPRVGIVWEGVYLLPAGMPAVCVCRSSVGLGVANRHSDAGAPPTPPQTSPATQRPPGRAALDALDREVAAARYARRRSSVPDGPFVPPPFRALRCPHGSPSVPKASSRFVRLAPPAHPPPPEPPAAGQAAAVWLFGGGGQPGDWGPAGFGSREGLPCSESNCPWQTSAQHHLKKCAHTQTPLFTGQGGSVTHRLDCHFRLRMGE